MSSKHDALTGTTVVKPERRQLVKHDVDTLMLCIAGAWLFGTISGGRARELADRLGRTAADIENLKFAERREAERDGRTLEEMLHG